MIESIKREVARRRISRICHVTPSRNLIHIITGTEGVLATRKLRANERAVFTQNDLLRLDNHPECISCSVEFPNAWYYSKVSAKDPIFKDWVVLLIDPKYLWKEGTLFCPRNAAAGQSIMQGQKGFDSLFAPSVRGAGRYTYTRTLHQRPCCPTDEQAEVLIPDRTVLFDSRALSACIRSGRHPAETECPGRGSNAST